MKYLRFTKCDSADVAMMNQNLFALVNTELADRNSLDARKFYYETPVLVTADNGFLLKICLQQKPILTTNSLTLLNYSKCGRACYMRREKYV
jgi:hypothetical protein